MGDLIVIIFTIVGIAIGLFIYEFFDTSGLAPLLGAIFGFIFSFNIFILPWNVEEKTVTYPLYKNEDNQYFTQSSNDGYITALCVITGKRSIKNPYKNCNCQ